MARHNIDDYNKSLTPEQRKERSREAGIASGVKRNERIAIRDALRDFLDTPASDLTVAREVCKTYGISTDLSVKTVFIAACVLNTLKMGTLKDISAMIEILNERDIAEENRQFMAIMEAMKSI